MPRDRSSAQDTQAYWPTLLLSAADNIIGRFWEAPIAAREGNVQREEHSLLDTTASRKLKFNTRSLECRNTLYCPGRRIALSWEFATQRWICFWEPRQQQVLLHRTVR